MDSWQTAYDDVEQGLRLLMRQSDYMARSEYSDEDKWSVSVQGTELNDLSMITPHQPHYSLNRDIVLPDEPREPNEAEPWNPLHVSAGDQSQRSSRATQLTQPTIGPKSSVYYSARSGTHSIFFSAASGTGEIAKERMQRLRK